MRWMIACLSVLLVGAIGVGAYAVVKQRASIVGLTNANGALDAALGEKATALATRDMAIDGLRATVAKLEADRDAQDKALATQVKAAAAREHALSELGELQKDRDAAKARLEQLQKFVGQLKKLIDTGKLSVEVRRGRLSLVMPNDVLFDEAKVAVKPDAIAALREIATTLKSVRDRQFEIVGHTDSTPIKSAEFPSNWELSTARALAVVKLLIEGGVPGSMLAAAGRGEFEPREGNFTPYGRAKNRRIEIVLEPQVGELMKLSQLKM